MPIIDRKHGIVSYHLAGRSTSVTFASNRQRKLLRFFDVPFGQGISAGAAGWEIAAIMSDDESRSCWRRYLFLTNDYGSDTDQLMSYDPQALQNAEVPDDWSSSLAAQSFKDELIEQILFNGSPFDTPMPRFAFGGNVFIFTGKFGFGSRDACRKAVTMRGGHAPDQGVSREVDYLVIGTQGSPAWKRGIYGSKIEDALIARREHGSPAIVSEEHWLSILQATNPVATAMGEETNDPTV
jgi:hypothetical protein